MNKEKPFDPKEIAELERNTFRLFIQPRTPELENSLILNRGQILAIQYGIEKDDAIELSRQYYEATVAHRAPIVDDESTTLNITYEQLRTYHTGLSQLSKLWYQPSEASGLNLEILEALESEDLNEASKYQRLLLAHMLKLNEDHLIPATNALIASIKVLDQGIRMNPILRFFRQAELENNFQFFAFTYYRSLLDVILASKTD